jgi:hypothetical protein
MKQNKLLKFIASAMIIGAVLNCGLFGIGEKKEDSSKKILPLLLLAGLNRNSGGGREMYAGFADIPVSIYKTVSSTAAATSIQDNAKVLATTDFKFQNTKGDASVSNVYDLVKITAKSTRDIAKTIGDLLKGLEGVSTGIQGVSTWGDQPAKFKYATSTTIPGGKKLEVWFTNGVSPYLNNKAIDMNFIGNSGGGDLSGYIFCRFLSKPTDSTFGKAYIKFDYKAATNTRSMVVILQDVGPLFTDKAHFFVQEINGVTTMDGAYTFNNFDPKAPGVAASNRIFVFNAAGNSTKAVMNAAFPLQSDTTTAIYANTTNGNIGQVWTNFVLANSTTVTALNNVGGACAAASITSPLLNGNPTALVATHSVANLKACMDANNPSANFKDLYFLANIKNPAYFEASGDSVKLYGVESLDATDANKISYAALEVLLPASTRAITSTTYVANFTPSIVPTLNLFTTGAGLNAGTTANTLPSINVYWGGTNPNPGFSNASGTANSVNGSKDDVAPF